MMEMEISNAISKVKKIKRLQLYSSIVQASIQPFALGKKTASIVSSVADESSTAVRCEIIFLTTLNSTLDNPAVLLTVYNDGIKLVAQLPPGQQNPWTALVKWLE